MQQEKQRGTDRQKDGFAQQDTRPQEQKTAALHIKLRREVSCIQTHSRAQNYRQTQMQIHSVHALIDTHFCDKAPSKQLHLQIHAHGNKDTGSRL